MSRWRPQTRLFTHAKQDTPHAVPHATRSTTRIYIYDPKSKRLKPAPANAVYLSLWGPGWRQHMTYLPDDSRWVRLFTED